MTDFRHGPPGPYRLLVNYADTPRLAHELAILEPLSVLHQSDLVEAVGAGDIWRTWYARIPSPATMGDEIHRRLALQAQGLMAPWAVLDPVTGRAVGMTSFHALDPMNRRVEIGYTWLGRAAHGTGINPAAKLLLLRRAFEVFGCVAVELRAHWHNHQSRAAIERLGAKQDGVLRNHQLFENGTVRDTVVYSIISSEWPTVRFGLEDRLAQRLEYRRLVEPDAAV